MKKLLLVLEAYIRLAAYDIFMSRHDLAALHSAIKNCHLRPRRGRRFPSEYANNSVDLACAFYPKQVLCLQRSAVLVRMLRKRGILASLVIGAQKLPFKAHAWVEVDGQVINDRLVLRETFLVMEIC